MQTYLSSRAGRWLPAIILVLPFLLFYWRVFSLGTLGVDNSYVPVPSLSLNAQSLLSAWNYVAFGYPTPKSQFSYDLISIFLRTAFGANLNLISKTFLLTPLPTCALTMYVLLSRFLGSRPWKIALSFGYAVNGFATTIFLTGTAASLTVAAVFPLFLLVSLRFFEGQFPAKSLLSASMLLAIAMSFNMQAYSWFMLFVPFAAVVILCERGKAGILLRGLLFAAGLTTIAFLLLLPALLVPITSAIGGKTATALVGYTPSAVIGTIKSFYVSFTNLNNLYFLEGMMVVISILGLFLDWSRHSRELRYWSLLLITAGLLTLLVMLVLSNWTPSQAFAILIFYSFDYPQLLMFVTAWALVLLLALLVFQTSLERNKVKRKVLNAVIALVLLSLLFYPVYNIPGATTSSNQFYSGTEWANNQIPPSLTDVYSWFAAHDPDQAAYRILWLPSPPTDVLILLSRYYPNSILSLLVGDPRVGPPLQSMLTNGSHKAGLIFAMANVKYFVVDLSSVNYAGSWAEGAPRVEEGQPVGSPTEFVNLLAQQGDLVEVANNSEFVIFRNLDFVPMIAIYMNPANTLDFSVPNVRQIGPSSFEIHYNGTGPFYLEFGQSYDDGWNVFAGGQMLSHSNLQPFDTNAFYYSGKATGGVSLTLAYSPQRIQNLALLVSSIAWIVVVTGFALTTLNSNHSKRSSTRKQNSVP